MTTGVVTHGEPIVYVEPKDVPIMLRFLRDHTGTRCKQLVDITAVDIPTREKRFEVGHTPTPPHSSPVQRTTHPLSPRASHPWLPLRQAAARWTSTHDLTPSPHPALTPAPVPMLQVCYQLLSHDHNSRIRVKTLTVRPCPRPPPRLCPQT